MYDIIVNSGANFFFWIAAVLIGVIVAFSVGDIAKMNPKGKKEEDEA